MLLNPRKKRRVSRRRRKVSARRPNPRRSTRRRVTRRRRVMSYRSNPKKRSAAKAAAAPAAKTSKKRKTTRRRARRSSGGRMGGNILAQVKGVFSKENLTVAGGGVAATVLTNFILSRTKADGTSLLPMPMTNVAAAKIAYAIAIPVVGAILTRRMNPSLARGMVFGGLINGIVEAIKGYAPVETKKALGFAEYLEYTPMSALNGTPGYSAINQFSNVRPMNSAFANSSAFPADAWGR